MRRINCETMERSLSNHRTSFSGLIPYRWCLVSTRLLTCFVVLAALVQFVPVGVLPFRANVADDGDHAGCVSECLTVNTHVVEPWMATPSSVVQLANRKSIESVPLQSSWIRWDRLGPLLGNPNRACKRCKSDTDSRVVATLVDLKVRLQI
ncbi:hypothetical protein Poly59_59440 [Rubripirellula reticaptiva]|uniref:Uncharacterized protein n=1 Tax=Rubripirellula reticaptiva TaxID=2528013 RepID=A0A5C6EE85_9BACT|nr:hypothetical protein Poly59_59440 [Rubripirellula reticaptiva]